MSYSFYNSRLTKLQDSSKIPLILIACGSFSPITYLHLRMFEMARDQLNEQGKYEIVGGYFSPVSDQYTKEGLAPSEHRVKMCKLAVDSTSDWLMVDNWESLQPGYQRTLVVLDHFNEEININLGGIETLNGDRVKAKIILLAGGDLIESFNIPGVWSVKDLDRILSDYGAIVVERTGVDVYATLLRNDYLYLHRKNVTVVKQLIHNDISSTKIRLFIKRGMSIKYLLPNLVIDYIAEHNLYKE
ncbi:Nucleotidylyl transferase [Conidiobolus coronatus NRRL 28638]|uniref:Nicotinamide-nucleotide adenylyltransferase n=1 Tax=Conidiobolus coronatus (strain ATCC 28846 / CBS 209.66 / NRRL 28638) TaxID=796925 RepID=A0A137P8F1_CONC2|nr:Nucleotidylyl transferase [Conidiobolus coronatus NRRL 28638]|eukprot:KXN71283.1 Nucleotidylyl transferase [Conidiobolus coronatus NRRL 28638]